jgi:hypothetical protein
MNQLEIGKEYAHTISGVAIKVLDDQADSDYGYYEVTPVGVLEGVKATLADIQGDIGHHLKLRKNDEYMWKEVTSGLVTYA